MVELLPEYVNKLSIQIVLISSLLGGFSLTLIASILLFKESDKNTNILFKMATIAASFFLVTIFAMTSVMMMTTKGYPKTDYDFSTHLAIGGITFYIGVLALMTVIALSGWVISRSLGRFTTILSIAVILLLLFVTIS